MANNFLDGFDKFCCIFSVCGKGIGIYSGTCDGTNCSVVECSSGVWRIVSVMSLQV